MMKMMLNRAHWSLLKQKRDITLCFLSQENCAIWWWWMKWRTWVQLLMQRSVTFSCSCVHTSGAVIAIGAAWLVLEDLYRVTDMSMLRILVESAYFMFFFWDWQVANLLREEIPQIYTLCGRGTRSTMRVLRPGLAVTELAVAPLPSTPTAAFTIRRSAADEFDCYIIVSFQNATLVSLLSMIFIMLEWAKNEAIVIAFGNLLCQAYGTTAVCLIKSLQTFDFLRIDCLIPWYTILAVILPCCALCLGLLDWGWN